MERSCKSLHLIHISRKSLTGATPFQHILCGQTDEPKGLPMKRLLVLFVLCLLTIGIPLSARADSAELKLLATTFPMHQLARRVVEGQAGIQLSLLLPAQAGCPHDYALTPQDMRKLADADVLLVNGLGLEEFLGAPIRKANPNLKIIDASRGVDGILPYAADRADKEGYHHESEGRHTEANPHLFASPRMMARMAVALAEKLIPLFPEGAERFRANAQSYANELNSLADKFAELSGKVKNNRIVTQHGVFDYLARDAGLEVIAVVQAHAGQEPAAAEMLRLIRTIRTRQAGAIFTEPQYPDKIGRTLSMETEVPLAVLDPVATGPENAARDYYVTTMRGNLAVLEKTLGLH